MHPPDSTPPPCVSTPFVTCDSPQHPPWCFRIGGVSALGGGRSPDRIFIHGTFMRAPPPGSARPGSCAPRPLPPCGRYEPVGAVDPSVPAVVQETRHINHSLLRLHRTLTSLTRADVCVASNPGASVCVGGGGASVPPNPSDPGFHGGFHLRREGSDSVGWVAHSWSIFFFRSGKRFYSA